MPEHLARQFHPALLRSPESLRETNGMFQNKTGSYPVIVNFGEQSFGARDQLRKLHFGLPP
jgi:hypothetical protein